MTSPPVSPPAARSGAPHRFEGLDSLRGVCACMLVLYHLGNQGHIHNNRVVENGFLFVDFFFVLSGFVIAASYGDRLAGGFSIPRFMALRLGRIYPLHLLVLAVFLLFEIVFLLMPGGMAGRTPFTDSFSLSSLGACLLLIQPFVGPEGTPWNGPSWSIAVEVWTYLVFALLFRWLGRWMVPAALLIAMASATYLGFLTDRYLNVFHDGAFARCLYGFSLGVVAYRAHGRGKRIRLSSAMATTLESIMVVAIATLVALAGASPLSLALPPFFFLGVLLFAREAGWVSRMLRTKPFLLIGAASYSIYMIHLFLILRMSNGLQLLGKLTHGRIALVDMVDGHSRIAGGPWFGDLLSIVMLGVVIGLAHLTYRFVEKPAQAWSRRRVLGDHPRRATIAAEREAPTF